MIFAAVAIWFVGAVTVMAVCATKTEDDYDLTAAAFAAMLWPAFAAIVALFSPVIIGVLVVKWWKRGR